MLRSPASGSNRGRSLTARRAAHSGGTHTNDKNLRTSSRSRAGGADLGRAGSCTGRHGRHVAAALSRGSAGTHPWSRAPRLPRACRSTTRPGSSPTAGTPGVSPCPRSSAASTCRPTSTGGRPTSGSGRRNIPRRRTCSPSSTTTRRTSRRGPFTWTVGRTPARTRPTPGWAFRPAAGTATCSSSRRPTSSRGGCAATACR